MELINANKTILKQKKRKWQHLVTLNQGSSGKKVREQYKKSKSGNIDINIEELYNHFNYLYHAHTVNKKNSDIRTKI